ncbi:MAG: hypothetical protein V7K89_22605 [Nostoc sp.]|uniref:hypothetical protein n=1 Tax=Nostoc sp. TaxID=1180 RepID=UPI002FFCACCD
MLEISEKITQKKSTFITIILATITLFALVYYLGETQWNVVELLRFGLGVIFLWMPLGALFYLLLKRQVQKPIVRFTFSAIASYTLTTLIYFGLAVFYLELLFYIGQIAIFIGLIIYSTRRKNWLNIQIQSLSWRQFDWVLALLIAASLVVNIPYQITWKYSPTTNTYQSLLNFDYNYFVGRAYELARHVPPLQQATRAGIPERAYHMFSHLTAMLLSRFTGQTDMLRTQLVYHYIIIEIGMCLSLYSIVKILTNSKVAGYLATATMYIVAIPYFPLIEKALGYFHFYFNLFPQFTNSIEFTIVTSPQMYSGMLVAYGIFLGVLLISVRYYKKQPVSIVLLVTSIMVVATSRFQAIVFLPMLPGFVLLTAYSWKRTRQRVYLIAAGLAVALSLVMFLEMQSPIYLSGSASLKLGFNNITNFEYSTNWINDWPFSTNIYALLNSLIHNSTVLKWVWQIISTSAFVVLMIIGIPLLIISSIYFSSKPARQEFLLFTSLIVWMPVASTLGAICLTNDYDGSSLGSELLIVQGWYLFLLIIPGLYQVYRFFQLNLYLAQSIQICVVVAFVVLSLATQQLTKPNKLGMTYNSQKLEISASEQLALAYLHDNMPQNSVMLTNKYIHDYSVLASSITGRSAYLELTSDEDPLNRQSLKIYPSDNREKVIKDLWTTSQSEQFCRLLTTTPVTHVIEYSTHPLLINNPFCMQSIWESSNKILASSEKVTIWKINR